MIFWKDYSHCSFPVIASADPQSIVIAMHEVPWQSRVLIVHWIASHSLAMTVTDGNNISNIFARLRSRLSRKILVALLTLAMVFATVPGFTLAAFTADGISYIDANDTSQTRGGSSQKSN
jgi:hypothetical protein